MINTEWDMFIMNKTKPKVRLVTFAKSRKECRGFLQEFYFLSESQMGKIMLRENMFPHEINSI